MTDRVEVASFTVVGEPVSKARARFTNYGSKTRAYTPGKTMQAERTVAAMYRQQTGYAGVPSTEETFAIEADFYNGTQQRRDVDNMLKLLLDGLNGVAWVDDMQVMEVVARKHYVTKAEARTAVTVYSLGLRERPTRVCKHCGRIFRIYASWAAKVYCSRDCQLASRRAARMRVCANCDKQWDPGKPVRRLGEFTYCSKACMVEFTSVTLPCTNCGKQFVKAGSYVRRNNFCSGDCSTAYAKAHRVRVPKGKCIDCGGPVSRREYLRCRGCSREHSGRTGTKGNPRPV